MLSHKRTTPQYFITPSNIPNMHQGARTDGAKHTTIAAETLTNKKKKKRKYFFTCVKLHCSYADRFFSDSNSASLP